MELGACVLLPDVETTVRTAQIAEQAGIGWFGVCDSPYLYVEPHAAMQAAARATSSMRIGTFVTNPVTRHWSVQAGAWRALAELAPGRAFMGIAPGDSAVHSVGLPPASPAEMAEYVDKVREHGPGTLPVMVAAGGPASVRRAAAYADELVIGQGASADAMGDLGAIAAAARNAADPARPMKVWSFVLLNLAGGPRPGRGGASRHQVCCRRLQPPGFRRHVRRQGGASGAARAPPQALRRLQLRRALEAGRIAQCSPTRARRPRRFLFDRFAIVDTPEAAAEKLMRSPRRRATIVSSSRRSPRIRSG